MQKLESSLNKFSGDDIAWYDRALNLPHIATRYAKGFQHQNSLFICLLETASEFRDFQITSFFWVQWYMYLHQDSWCLFLHTLLRYAPLNPLIRLMEWVNKYSIYRIRRFLDGKSGVTQTSNTCPFNLINRVLSPLLLLEMAEARPSEGVRGCTLNLWKCVWELQETWWVGLNELRNALDPTISTSLFISMFVSVSCHHLIVCQVCVSVYFNISVCYATI